MEDQLNNRSLNHVPDALKFLDEVLKQPLDDLLQYLWANGYEGCTDEELSVNKMIRYILTDFHLNCTITTNNDNERTPFCQRFIPIFKAFAGVTRLMDLHGVRKVYSTTASFHFVSQNQYSIVLFWMVSECRSTTKQSDY
ncbi:unnamed protein product [Absidia cylindrospora]